MTKDSLVQRYNYHSFLPHLFEPWMRFDQSPPLGKRGPNFALYTLNEMKVHLSDIWGETLYTVVEFGSFT